MTKLSHSIERHLFHLLFQEDSIDIQGFGRIEVQRFDAEIQTHTGLCMPPARRLSFSPIAKKSEVLINHLVRYESLSFDSAIEIIQITTRGWKLELSQGRRLRLEGIGSFSKTGLQWVFQASVEANFLPEAYGLPIFRVTPLNQLNSASTEFKNTSRLNPPTPSKKREKWMAPIRTAAVMAVIISLLALGTTKEDYREMIQNASFQPNWKLLEKKINNWITIEKPIIETTDIPRTNYDPKLISEEIKAESAEIKINGQFALIVGAFGEMPNAERLVKILQTNGYPAALIRKSGELTKVAIRSFDNRESAQSEKENISLQFPAVWIYTQ